MQQNIKPKINLLFVGVIASDCSTGALQVTNRNLSLLKQVLGHEGVVVFDLAGSISEARKLHQVVRGFLSGLTDKTEAQVLRAIESHHISIVFIDNSLLGKLAKSIKSRHPNVKVILNFHNDEVHYFKALLKTTKKIWHLLSIQAAAYNQRLGINNADSIITLNERDKLMLKQAYGAKSNEVKWNVVPVSYRDTHNIEYATQKKNNDVLNLLFIGSYFFPNFQGIKWFIINVLPKINAKLTIVGKGFEVVKDELEKAGSVQVVGYAKELAPFYQEADVVVAPIFVGGGMKTKIAEALMHGKIVLGTRESFEGYASCPNVLIECNTVSDFVSWFQSNKPLSLSQYGKEARALFLSSYSHEVAIKKLRTIINNLAKN